MSPGKDENRNVNNTLSQYILKLCYSILPVICFWSLSFTGNAQPIKDWDKGYGGAGWEDCNAAIQTSDLGYLLGGITTSDVSGDVDEPSLDDLSIPWWLPNIRGDYWVLRTDDNGNELWNARFGGDREDRLWGVAETNDGGFILGGQSYSGLSGTKTDTCRGSSDYWVVKIDGSGVKEWDRTYGGDSTDILNVLLQTQDGGYILGGWSISSGWTETDSIGEKSDTLRGGFDWWIVKIDPMGDIEWERSYGGNNNEQLADIVQRADGTYIVAGGSESTISGEVDSMNVGERDFWMLHLDVNGDKLNEYRYGSVDFDDLNRVIITSDEGYLLAGSSLATAPSGDKTGTGYGSFDWWIIKIDTFGTIQWQHTFGGSELENVYSLSQNSINHYLLGGPSRSVDGDLADNVPRGDSDFWIMYLDPNGNKLWDERYGGDQAESLEQLFQTDDGGYLMAGHSRSDVSGDKEDPNEGLNDFWIVKTLCNINVSLSDTIVCPDDEVTLSAYDPDCIDCVYTWSDIGTTNDSIRMVSTPVDITYGVTLTDGVGCQRSDEINITVTAPPVVDLGADDQLCLETAYTLDAENPGLDFQWSTGATQQILEVYYPDTYQVTVTDAMGCETEDNISLSAPDLSAYIITANTSCGEENGTATLVISGGTGNYDIVWSNNGSSDITITDLARGGYTATIDDGNCTIEVSGIVGFEASPEIDWTNHYGGSQHETINDIKETSDGGYIVVGSSESSDSDLINNYGGKDVWVKKLDANGLIQWQNNLGGSLDDEAMSVYPLGSGGFIIAAYSYSSDIDVGANNGNKDVWLIRIDNTGALIWEENYGGSLDDEAVSIIETLEGGFILVGNTFSADGDVSINNGSQDAWVLKISANGLLEWEQTFGLDHDDQFVEVFQEKDGSYVIGGHTTSDIAGNNGANDFWILKIDFRGNLLWQETFGGSAEDLLFDMCPAGSGAYMLAGSTLSSDFDVNNNNGGGEAWVLKVDANGMLDWQNSYGGTQDDLAMSIDRLGDGHFMLSGISSSDDADIENNLGISDYFLLKIDENNGQPIWSKSYGSSLDDRAFVGLQSSDGAYLLGGVTDGSDNDVSGNNGGDDIWILKLDAPPLPQVDLPGDQVICAMDTAFFAPLISNCEGCTWEWDDGLNDSLRQEVLSANTTFTFTVTDINGCTASDDIFIELISLPVVDLGTTIDLCAGESMELDAGSDGLEYQWSTSEATQIINVDTSASYVVTVTGVNSCVTEDSVMVTVHPIPAINLGNDTTLCDGNILMLDAGAGYSYQWSSVGGNNQVVVVTDADTYSVTITDVNTCTASDEIIVNFDTAPQEVNLNALDPGPFCPGTSFEITIQNSEPGILYELFDGNDLIGGSVIGDGGAVNISTGALTNTTSFNVVASIPGACSDTLMAGTIANIGDVEVPLITCRPDTAIIIEDGNCNPELSIAAPVQATDNCGIESLTYLFSGATVLNSPPTGINDASGQLLNLGLTTINYIATDSFGNMANCSFTVEVIDQTSPLMGTAANDLTVECDGAGNILAFNTWLNNHGGATAFDECSDLTWSTLPADPAVSDACGETGSVEVVFIATDDAGNSVSSSAIFTIEDTQAPIFTVPADITISASEDPFDLAITGDVVDESDNCDGGVSDQGPRTATYSDVVQTEACVDIITRTWTLNDECGNTFSAEQMITREFNAPGGGLSGSTEICEGESAELTFDLSGSSSSFNVIYSDGNNEFSLDNISNGHTIQISPGETTTYTLVSIVDVSRLDCEGAGTADVEIIVNEIPTVENVIETCDLFNTGYSVSFEISGGTGTYTVGGNYAGLVSGNTFLSVVIPRDSSYTFLIDDENACGPVEISGTYDCQCTTEAGTFQENMLMGCVGETLLADHIDSNLDGNDLINFILHDGDANTIGNNIFSVGDTPEFSLQTGMQPGTVYYVTVIAGTDDGNGQIAIIDACYSESTGVPIIFNNLPVVVITPATDTELNCDEQILSLSGINSQAQGIIDYQWSVIDEGNIISATSNSEVLLDEVGSYQLVITDQLTGCTAGTSINITINENTPNAVIADPDRLTCDILTVQLDASASSTGADFNYQWSGGMIEAGAQSLTPVVSASGLYTLVVTDMANGCTDDEQIFVETNYEAPDVSIEAAPMLDCNTPEINLNGSFTSIHANVSINWLVNPGSIISGENTLTPVVDEEGLYTLVVTNLETGCSGEADILVNIDPAIPQGLTMEAINPECFGDDNGSIIIQEVEGGTAPFSYSLDGENFYTVTNFANLVSGEYNLTVQDALGCEWDTLITLASAPELLVDLGDNQEIALGDSIQLDVFINQAIDTFVWNFPELQSLNPVVQPANQTTYTLEVMNASGCIAKDFITIVVRKDRNVYVPTAFSPNGDGINDKFTIFSDESVVNINTFRIFNRWGETLFIRNDLAPNAEPEGWDGTFKGRDMQQGVYVFFAEIEFFDGRKEIFKGDFTLIR